MTVHFIIHLYTSFFRIFSLLPVTISSYVFWTFVDSENRKLPTLFYIGCTNEDISLKSGWKSAPVTRTVAILCLTIFILNKRLPTMIKRFDGFFFWFESLLLTSKRDFVYNTKPTKKLVIELWSRFLFHSQLPPKSLPQSDSSPLKFDQIAPVEVQLHRKTRSSPAASQIQTQYGSILVTLSTLPLRFQPVTSNKYSNDRSCAIPWSSHMETVITTFSSPACVDHFLSEH